MDTAPYAVDLLTRVARMRLRDWEEGRAGLIDELIKRDDMPALFEEFTLKTVAECRIRVCLRRAYRKRFGVHADIKHADTTIHRNFGRF